MSAEHDVLTALFKAHVRNEIEEVKVAGEPIVVDVLPSDTEADALLWMRWDAATRDSILLYDRSRIYEKYADDLTWSDALETGAFYNLLAQACFHSGEQHKFVADVKEDLEHLGCEDA